MRTRLAVRLLPAVALLVTACASPAGLVAEAEQLYAQAHYFQAYQAIERVRASYPDDAEVERVYWQIRLTYLLREGQRKCFANKELDALQDFEKALVLDPGNPIAERWIQKCRVKLSDRATADGDRLRKFGSLEAALIKYHEALVHQPGNPVAEDGLRRLGEAWRRMQDEAHSHYLQGVRTLADQLFKQTRYHLLIALDKDPTLEEAVAPSQLAKQLLMRERFAEAQRMEEEGYFAPALREYREIQAAFPDFEGIDERIEIAAKENEAQELASRGEMAVYRGQYSLARELLERAYDLTNAQRDSIGERLMLVHEHEVGDRYDAAKDLELQHQYIEALQAYREIDEELPAYEDVRARIGDLEIRIEESEKAYKAGLEAEQRGDFDAAIQSYGDVLIYWPEHRDTQERYDRLLARKPSQDS